MKKIIFASSNPHKLTEVREILDMYQVLSLKDIGFDEEIEENGYSFQENALIKATAVKNWLEKKNEQEKYVIIAEDSGLCVKAINYEPGIYSARYSGKGDEANRQLLLSKLLTISDRTAYFQCYAVCLMPDGEQFFADGKTYGLITRTKIGDESFGYDCIFWSDKLQKTFGQATPEEKNSVSHRSVAMKQIKEFLNSRLLNSDDEEE